jgi:hypothetical protein
MWPVQSVPKIKTTSWGITQGPEKMIDTHGKTIHRGTMDRGFTVYTVLKMQ